MSWKIVDVDTMNIIQLQYKSMYVASDLVINAR